MDNVASAISELAEFLMAHDHDGQELTMAREMKEREIKNRQKLLRNLRVCITSQILYLCRISLFYAHLSLTNSRSLSL